MQKQKLFCSLACVATLVIAGCQSVGEPWGMSSSNHDVGSQPKVTDVDLFPNGVGYIGYQANVKRSQTVRLAINPNQVNDLLKTIVFFDPSNQPPEVNFATPIPLSVKLAGLPLSPSENGSWISLLSELKGRQVKLQFKHGKCVTGRLMGIRSQWPVFPQMKGKPQPENNAQRAIFPWPPRFADIYRDGKVRRVSLAHLISFDVVNHQLRASLRKALRYMAANRHKGAATITIRFRGRSQRSVQFGYATQAPLWRITYRLLLPASQTANQASNSAIVLADAIVHNTTSASWQHITLHINGSWPHSFIEDLRHPLYGRRPVIPAPADTSLIPQNGLFYLRGATAEGGFAGRVTAYHAHLLGKAATFAPPRMLPRMAMTFNGAQRRVRINSGTMAVPQKSNPAFNYVARDVSIRSEHSASFAILSHSISARIVSTIDIGNWHNHPRRAVLLVNNSGHYLPAGPITVFAGGRYVGEINSPAIAVNSKQALSFATDLSMAAHLTFSQSNMFSNATFSNGNLVLKDAVTKYIHLKLRNRHRHSTDVIVSLGHAVGWHLAKTHYQVLHLVSGVAIVLTASPMINKTYRVGQIFPQTSNVNLYTASPEQISALAHTKGMAAATADQLKHIVSLKKAMIAAAGKRAEIIKHMDNLNANESRIRQNLAAAKSVPKQAQIFAKELVSLDKQIAAAQQSLRSVQRRERADRRALNNYIRSLK